MQVRIKEQREERTKSEEGEREGTKVYVCGFVQRRDLAPKERERKTKPKG